MEYLYTSANRLEQPHNYMYTPFQGELLLQSYLESRMAQLQNILSAGDPVGELTDASLDQHIVPHLHRAFGHISPEAASRFEQLVGGGLATVSPAGNPLRELEQQAIALIHFSLKEPVETAALLEAVVAAQLSGQHIENVKEWSDRLIQRFEVTKKLYDNYPAGFRKGEGAGSSIRLYWLFALSLSLSYASSQQIKYISTLLKVCDLLLSLPESIRTGFLSVSGMSSVLATEIVSIQLLIEKKKINVTVN